MRKKNIRLACLLFLGAASFFLLLPIDSAFSAAVTSVADGHNTCDQCHGRFPEEAKSSNRKSREDRPAVIPADKIDVLCMGCHGPAGNATFKANIHGMPNYTAEPIGCIGCHDPHANNPNYLSGQNIKLIGEDTISGIDDYARISTPNSGEQYVVFESRGSDSADGFSIYSYADGDEDGNGAFDGICEVCHTQTRFHRNDATGEQNHYTGQNCTSCHAHVNQFLAVSGTGGGLIEVSGSVADESGFAWGYITLFLDMNGNGLYDEGEPTTETDENGNFLFTGLEEGVYSVLAMPGSIADGYQVTINTSDNITLITTTPLLANLEGTTWNDENLNGFIDGGETGAAGIRIFADLNQNGQQDTGEPVTSTANGGSYTLNNLDDGPYHFRIDETSLPDGCRIRRGYDDLYRVLGPGETNDTGLFAYRCNSTVYGSLSYPARLSWTPDGGYYVTDSKAASVFIYDSSGTVTRQLGGLDKPLGIISDAQGRIYVGNDGRDNVEIYSAAGTLQQVIGDGDLKMPNDLAFDRQQNLYVLDSRIKQVKVFDPNGVFIRHIGRAGNGDGRFIFPIAIAINYRMENDVEVGELFVADKQSSFIQVFDLEGNFLRSIAGPVIKSGYWSVTWIWEGLFIGLQSIAFDQNGMLHALDSYQDKVQILDPVTGAYQGYYDAFQTASDAHLQLDIDINPSGEVIMTNVTSQAVEHIHTVLATP